MCSSPVPETRAALQKSALRPTLLGVTNKFPRAASELAKLLVPP